MSHLFGTPASLRSDDPRLQTPPSRVGYRVEDPEMAAEGLEGIITWDPTYRCPRAWGWSRGLLMADEGGSNCLRPGGGF